MHRFASGLVAAVAGLLVACGGDEPAASARADALDRAQSIAALAGGRATPAALDTRAIGLNASTALAASAAPAAAPAARRRALAGVEAPADAPTQFLDYVERVLPQYFPVHQGDRTAGTLLYRQYPQTGAYLIVADQSLVYVTGGPFGPEVYYVGRVTDFLQPLGGEVSALSASGLVLAAHDQTVSVAAGASTFRFPQMLASGTPYEVSVRTQPAGQTCAVVNGSGRSGGASTPSVQCQIAAATLEARAPEALTDAGQTYGIDPSGIGGGYGGDGAGDGDGDGGAAGAAGDGTPLARSRITLTDAEGRSVVGLTDQNGRFLLRFPTRLFRAPYVLRVVDAAGHVRTSVITEPVRAQTAVWTQINPITDKIVSDALRPGVGGTDKQFTGADVDTSRLARAAADMLSSLRPALAAVGVGDANRLDALRAAYRYDGTGIDAVIDSINLTRDPATGATQLRSKLAAVSVDPSGTEQPRLVTASAPLAAELISQAASGALAHAKLVAWVNEFNRCLALSATDYAADAGCVDADGSRLVRGDFRHNGRDFRETLRNLFSEFDGSPVAGSSLRNPTILLVDRRPGSPVDDLALVQFTVLQPYIGPRGRDGPVGGAVEYPVVLPFRRDDNLSRARAGNWLAWGNQLRYDFTIEPRYYRFTQGNPARQASAPGYATSSLRLLALRQRWDAATRSYVDAGIRAVRVRGPGLPASGVVLAPSVACGASTYLALLNKTGAVPAGDTSTGLVQNDFRLASVLATGERFATPGSYFPQRDITVNQIPYLGDFSPIRAYSVYRFEVFLRSNPGNTTPDAVEFVRILAPLMPPEAVLKLPMNDPSPSLPLVQFGAAAIPANAAGAVNWGNNLFAAPVSSVSLYAEEADAANPGVAVRGFLLRSAVPGAYAQRSVPASQLVTVPSVSADPNCASGRLPAYDGVIGVYREVTLSSLQGQARVFSSLGWNR